ncbi:MAG: hypothetical protein IEMM0006_1117 [bacterium]|nr:MAG: hypothetical protein IEMM0006_1117 [bacterium]
MKKIKYILFTAVILSFFFITACSTTQSVPQDDVYYSTTPHNNVTITTTTAAASSATHQQEAKQTDKAAYRQGKIENISQATGQTASDGQYDVNYSAHLKKSHQSGDTSLDYYDNNSDTTVRSNNQQNNNITIVTPGYSSNLDFGNPYFGSSWSFGFGSYYGLGYGGYGWGYPGYGWGGGYYGLGYGGYGWGYPGFGWGGGYYGLGYGGYGWGYPGFGWGGGYYGLGYGGYGWGGGYYSPYYSGYTDYGHGGFVYRPRIHRGGGSSIPRSTAIGGSGIYTRPNAKSARRATSSISRKRVPVNPEGRNGKLMKPGSINGRPAGSMRFSPELAKKRSEGMRTQGKLNKPGGKGVGNKNTNFGISEARNNRKTGFRRAPAYRQEGTMPRPRFQKPKQYQSLESRSPRSSKEFYRAPTRPENRNTGRVSPRNSRQRPQTVRRQNIYRRPAGFRNLIYRGSSRRRSGVKVYNAPTRSFSSPNIFRAPARRNSFGSRPTRSFSAPPTRSFSAPVRTGSSSGSGGGGIRRSSGSGGIRR